MIDQTDRAGALFRLGATRLLNANPFAEVSGRYYDQSRDGGVTATLAGAADRLNIAPFIPARRFSIDRIGVLVTTGVGASTAKAGIWDADASGHPTGLLLGTGNLDCAAAAFVQETVAFTFEAMKVYWIGVHTSSTQTLRAISSTGYFNLGFLTNDANFLATGLRRSVAYASGLPTPWTYNAAELIATSVHSVRWRAV
jgi:hypothetical protein